MLVGIITTPKRQQYLSQLLASVTPYADKTFVYNDLEMQGATYNQSRILREVLPLAKPNEPVLMLDDDMVLTDNWYEDWQKIHEQAQADTYVLFTRHRHLLKYEAISRGWTKGLFKNSLYTCAIIYINQPDLADQVDQWYETRGKELLTEKRAKHYDVVLQTYFVDNGHEYVVTTPTLADHIGVQSTLGHQIGGSPMYKGNH
mgnify:CR=1 FL=1